MTLNALLPACNQESNRDSVAELSEADVRGAFERLRCGVLVWRVEGARTEGWKHNIDRSWELDPAGKALLAVLSLRGPQTSGELRGRCERVDLFEGLAEVEASLRRLDAGAEPLVAELAR